MFNILIKELKYRWIEFLLGVLITALVVVVFIIQHSLSRSAEDEIHKIAHNLGNNMLIVPGDADMAEFYSFKTGSLYLPDSYPRLAMDSGAGKHIRYIHPVLYGNLINNGEEIVIIGEEPGGSKADGADAGLPGALVTDPLAEKPGIGVGSIYAVNGIKFRVDGIINAGSNTPEYGVVIPLEYAQRILGKKGKISAIYLGGCWCSIDVPALGKMLESILPGTRSITLAGMLSAQKGAVSVMREYSDAFYLAAIIMVSGTILLLILSQIRRYRREFGIYMALGAPGEIIRMNLWIKSFIIGAAGGAAGYLVSFPLLRLLGSMLPEFSGTVLSGELLPVLGIAVLSSVIGGIIPAYTIFELDPVETLREE